MSNIVSRGSVLVYKRDGVTKVSAVATVAECERMARRVGGRIVKANGLAFRYAQGRTLRVLVNPAEAVAR